MEKRSTFAEDFIVDVACTNNKHNLDTRTCSVSNTTEIRGPAHEKGNRMAHEKRNQWLTPRF
jgi:hypothetical protein